MDEIKIRLQSRGILIKLEWGYLLKEAIMAHKSDRKYTVKLKKASTKTLVMEADIRDYILIFK